MGLALLAYPGWRQKDLNFLSDLKSHGLREFLLCPWIDSRTDVSPLNDFHSLTHLCLTEPVTGKLNFKNFQKLKSLKFDYRAGFKSFLECTELETLYISKHPFEDLLALCKMRNLKHLQLSGGKLRSLRGIESFKYLEELHIHYATELQNLEGIEHCSNLKNVVLYRCGEVPKNQKFRGNIDRREGMN